MTHIMMLWICVRLHSWHATYCFRVQQAHHRVTVLRPAAENVHSTFYTVHKMSRHQTGQPGEAGLVPYTPSTYAAKCT